MTDQFMQSKRDEFKKEWDASGQPYIAAYKAYKSILQLVGQVLSPLPTGGAPTMAHVLFMAGQTLEFFSYGIGDAIPHGDGTKRATESDTNMSSAYRTNGQEDFAIESASLSLAGKRVAYAAALDVSIVDPRIIAAYRGRARVLDPAAIMSPPQMFSPFNLEESFMSAVQPAMTFEFEFDRRRREQIGTLDQVPEGGAKSHLRSNGDATTHNRIRFPEGYGWRREGKPDQELLVRSILREDVVVPISLVALDAIAGDQRDVPTAIYLDLAFRLHGLSFGPISRN